MTQGYCRFRQSGTILVFTLWSLGILTIFAIQLGVIIRQKITFVKRLDERHKLDILAKSGVKKAVKVLRKDPEFDKGVYTVSRKMHRHNNPAYFGRIYLGDGTCEISSEGLNEKRKYGEQQYGLVDEEIKINLNTASRSTLNNLIKNVLECGSLTAENLANAIYDWREFGESELVGFSSDAYYENLRNPYPIKNSPFEVIEELLLVKGMNGEILAKLSAYLTIYGEGRVNVNTASRVVLISLGFDEELTDKILSVRRGSDAIEATGDDHVFQSPADLITDLEKEVTLEPNEIAKISQINTEGKLGARSYFYLIRSKANLLKSAAQKIITCVYNTSDNKIEYWREY